MFRVQKDQWHTGFHMTFKNGWTVSVQFGKMNYCSNRGDSRSKEILFEGADAEIAAWDKDGKWYIFDQNNDVVNGWNDPDAVADFIAMIKNMES